jgi:hypothetical protein
MTDLDLERLGDMWRQQPDPAELERLQRSARTVSRRARLQQIADIVAAAVVAGAVLFLVVSSGRPQTVLLGGAALLVLLVSNVRQRRLRQIELRSLSGTTEDMLDQSIDRVETTLRHNRISLVAVGPVLVLAMLFAATADGGDTPLRAWLGSSPLLRALWLGVGVAVLGAIILSLLFSIRRGRRELGRLQTLRNSYRVEGETYAAD